MRPRSSMMRTLFALCRDIVKMRRWVLIKRQSLEFVHGVCCRAIYIYIPMSSLDSRSRLELQAQPIRHFEVAREEAA